MGRRAGIPGRPPARDLALLLLAVVAVSTAAPLIRRASAPALAVAFWRNALAAVLIVPLVAFRPATRREARALAPRERSLALWAGVLLAGHFATWVPSLAFTTVASSVALVTTQPVWTALAARLRGEDVPLRAWAGIAVALLGVLLLTGVDLAVSPRALLGDALALSGGVLAAVYVTVGAEVRRTTSTTVYTAVCYSCAALLLLLACLGGGLAVSGYDGPTWGALVALAVGPQLLGHSVLNRVLRTTSPTVVSVAILFEIVGATFLAWAFFGETPPVGAYPAAVLIAAGVALVVLADGSPRPATARPAAPPM